MNKIIVIDTSMYCVWLQIPGFENCGRDGDLWDYERINAKISEEIKQDSTLVLPLATIIETGNHLSQSKGDRFRLAEKFCDLLLKSIDNENPWAAFSEQSDLWNDDNMKQLAADWPLLASQKVSLGDATIKNVAEYYAQSRCEVEILTGDEGLKAYQPLAPPDIIPRRRKK